MRTLPLNFREAIFSQESGEVPVFLLTISHPDLDENILLSSDATERLSTDPLVYGTLSRGREFLFVGMDLSLPDEQDKSPPASTMTISNVGREMIPLARSVTSPPTVKIEAILASDPDAVLFDVPALDMIGLQYNAGELIFSLVMDAMAREPFPAGTFDPASFPGLFI